MDTKKILLLAGGVLAVLIVALVVFLLTFVRRVGPVTLTYWGLWEPEEVFQGIIADYERLHPNVTIKYIKQSPLNYRDRVVTALSGTNGPDIVRIHDSWVLTLASGLSPMPANVYSQASFKQTFYPAAATLYPYAIPLEIDDLAMYVNDDILRAGGVSVPTIWDGDQGFMATARKLTVRDSSGRIKTAGAAMGTASNVDQWQDIVGLMMAQAGDNFNAEALNYYVAFATSEHMWDETLDNSTLAFANGQVAMYFGPSWRYFDIKQINPNLNFHLAPVPQLAGGAAANYASFWTEAVSKRSSHQKEAWDFLKYLSSREVLTKLYAAETNVRGFGEPYARTDMADLLSADPNVGPFIAAAPTAKTWYLASNTGDGDTGINTRIGKYYADAINSMLQGNNASSVLQTVQQGVTQVLSQYGLTK
ncbi:extracellular solute-binding protein [Patescibacteria group bacterium]|nr:extracellular solute-binding protein [Patescibacteria group bacterium]